MGKAEYILDLELVSGELAFYLKNTLLRSATLNFSAIKKLCWLIYSFLTSSKTYSQRCFLYKQKKLDLGT